MPYSRMTRTRFGVVAIRYIRGNGAGHNGVQRRNEYLDGINMLPDSVAPFEEQMQPHWDKAPPKHTVQIDRFIVSYSKKELDPSKPEDIEKAHNISCEIAELLCKGLDPENEDEKALIKTIAYPVKRLVGKGIHQAVVATQTDGVGGYIHTHIAVNDVAIDTHKGLNSGLYQHESLRKIVDYICQKHFELAKSEPIADKEPQYVRNAKQKNADIEKDNAEEIKRAKAEGRDPDLKPLNYIWQDDLKARIREAAEGATNEYDFHRRLIKLGVEMVPYKRKNGTKTIRHPKTKKQPEHYTYELIDLSGFSDPEDIPPNPKRKSYKLGANYQPEGIAAMSRASSLDEFLKTPAEPAKDTAQVSDIPAPAAKKTSEQSKQKPLELTAKEKEKQAMEDAKQRAQAHVYALLAAMRAWGEEPTEENLTFAEQKWSGFVQWRVQRRKDKGNLPTIYSKNNSGFIDVDYDELKDQYIEYLYSAPEETSKPTTEPAPKPLQAEVSEKAQQASSVLLETEPEDDTAQISDIPAPTAKKNSEKPEQKPSVLPAEEEQELEELMPTVVEVSDNDDDEETKNQYIESLDTIEDPAPKEIVVYVPYEESELATEPTPEPIRAEVSITAPQAIPMPPETDPEDTPRPTEQSSVDDHHQAPRAEIKQPSAMDKLNRKVENTYGIEPQENEAENGDSVQSKAL